MSDSFVAAVLALGLLIGPAPSPAAPAATTAAVSGPEIHMRPVEGPIIDPFRPPPRPWLAGNRGIEIATASGSIAVASAAGVVSFSGPVAGRFHVTVRHGDRLRTTLAFVSEPLVEVGRRVAAGDPLAIVGESVHFTARVDDTYIDPELLFGPHRWIVRLVPLE
jgi:murein DD-endopeptidase MepM/ murein hydrolase activator NlpD